MGSGGGVGRKRKRMERSGGIRGGRGRVAVALRMSPGEIALCGHLLVTVNNG